MSNHIPLPPDDPAEMLDSIKQLMDLNEELKDALATVMRQNESDLKSAHAEICKLQGLDPEKNTWPAWTPQAHSIRWFAMLREKHGITP